MSIEEEPRASAYWSTTVSRVEQSQVFVRGYDLQDVIGSLPFAASCFLLIRGRVPTPAEAQVLDGVLNAILDYSLHKPGTVAARYTVSANPSMAAGLASSVLAVGKHTLDPEPAGRFILDAFARLGPEGDPATLAQDLVDEARARKERIPGFGHPVFRHVDPRAKKIKDLAERHGLWGGKAQLYEAVHRAFRALPGRDAIPINDVGVMAAVLVEMGFTPEETTGLAVMSMLPGVIAHVSEELREGPPIRIVPDEIAAYPDQSKKNLAADVRAAGWGNESSR